jgi:hypothetical protein
VIGLGSIWGARWDLYPRPATASLWAYFFAGTAWARCALEGHSDSHQCGARTNHTGRLGRTRVEIVEVGNPWKGIGDLGGRGIRRHKADTTGPTAAAPRYPRIPIGARNNEWISDRLGRVRWRGCGNAPLRRQERVQNSLASFSPDDLSPRRQETIKTTPEDHKADGEDRL